MAASTAGIVLIKNSDINVFDILDKIKEGLTEIYTERLTDSIKKHVPDANIRAAFILPEEERKKFSSVNLKYSKRGVFRALFSVPSDVAEKNIEHRDMYFDLKTYENDIRQDLNLKDEDKPEGFTFSVNRWGSDAEIIMKVLEKFGDDTPAFLIRNDCSFGKENVVKIGNAKTEFDVEYITKEEFEPIRKVEMEERRNKYSPVEIKSKLEKKAKSKIRP